MQTTIKQDTVLHDFLERIGPVRPEISRFPITTFFWWCSKKNDKLMDTLYEAVMDVLLTYGRLVSLKVLPEQEFARLHALQTPFIKQIEQEGVLLG